MNTIIRIVIVMVLLCLSISSRAADTWHTSRIATLYALADGTVVIMFENNAPSCTGIGAPYKYQYIKIGENGVSEAGFKEMFTLATFAASAGLEVTVNFDNSSSQCYINRMRVLVLN